MVWFYDHSADAGWLTVVVLNADTGETVISHDIPAAELPSDGWLEMDFSAIPDSAGQTYVLQIAAAGDPTLSGVKVGVSDRNEFLDGELSIGSETQIGDLFFRYSCLAGLEGLLHPSGR